MSVNVTWLQYATYAGVDYAPGDESAMDDDDFPRFRRAHYVVETSPAPPVPPTPTVLVRWLTYLTWENVEYEPGDEATIDTVDYVRLRATFACVLASEPNPQLPYPDPFPQYMREVDLDRAVSQVITANIFRDPASGWAQLATIVRPRDWVATYRVVPGQANATAFGIYTSATAAHAAAVADHEAQIVGAFSETSQATPHQRRLVICEAATYAEALPARQSYIDIVGATGNAADVVFQWAGASNVCVTTGASVYTAHLTLEHTSSDPEWHPLRDAAPSGDYDMGKRQRRTVLFHDVVFKSSATGLAGKSAVDMTPGSGLTMIFTDCSFLAPGQPQAINCGSNSGLTPAQGGVASHIVFVNPHVQANFGWIADPTLPNYPIMPDSASPVGLTDKGAGRGDTVHWIGGTYDYGSFNAIKGTVNVAPGGTTAGYNTVFYIDPTLTPLGNYGGGVLTSVYNGGSTLQAGHLVRDIPVTFDLPSAGVTPAEWRFYGPNTVAYIRPSTFTPKIASTGKGSLVANRIYYVPVPVPRGARISDVKIGVGVEAGTANAAVLMDDGSFVPVLGNANAIRTAVTLPTKAPQWLAKLAERFYFPAYRIVWVAFVVSSATATVDIVANAGNAGLPCYYIDGWAGAAIGAPGALTALPAADAAPFPVLVDYSPAQPAVSTSSSFTYTIPAGAKSIEVMLYGGGGGGGGGRRGAAGSVRFGGGGGGGGGFSRAVIPVEQLPGLALTGNVGAAGAAGAAATTDDTNGGAGATGGVTSLNAAGVEILRANGGGAGGAGTTASGAAGVAGDGNLGAASPSSAGSAGGAAGSAGGNGTNTYQGGAAGGAAGGGITAADAASAGGSAGKPLQAGTYAGGTAGAISTNGVAGANSPQGVGPGQGGGGGGSSLVAVGGSGGAGGRYGAGGGGGGASVNGNNSGAGGLGGEGLIIVIPHFN